MEKKIHLMNGGWFDFAHPDRSEYTIHDIALNLSHVNRFTGSTEIGYSVAQHSVYVSLLLEMWGHKDMLMKGLMHDAGESFLNDIASPLKQMLPDYKKIEHKVEASIFKKYGLQFPMDPKVKEADLAMFAAERICLQPKVKAGLEGIVPAPFEIVPWDAKKAEKEFLKRYFELGGVDK